MDAESESVLMTIICHGVTAGVLSPLLFAIFIMSIFDYLTSFYHLDADNLQIYAQAIETAQRC